MGSTGLGYGLSLVFLVVAAIWTSPDKPLQFLDPHGAFIVIVGTAIISVIAVPWIYIKRFFLMFKAVTRRLDDDSILVLQQLVEMAEKARIDIQKVQEVEVRDFFLKDAVQLILEGFEVDEIELILRRRIEVQKERENADAKMFKNLGKYPPAMGLIGTVMGMISLLGTLGQEGAESKVGPSMSVALTATLYGVILANIVVLPVADNLIFRTQKLIAKREMIVEGILLVKQRITPVIVREILISHLAPNQRYDVKKKPAAAAAAKNVTAA